MTQKLSRSSAEAFDVVKAGGLTLPDVEATTRYDGSPVLKLGGVFVAGLASHSPAEPNTLVVRSSYADRERLIEDAPETYYLTQYYGKYPLVLVRLSCVQGDALLDLLRVSRCMASMKTRVRLRTSPQKSRIARRNNP